MPLFGLGVLILWLGWFGFNPGRRSARSATASPRSSLVTNLAAAAGVVGRGRDDLPQDRRRSTSAWPATARSRRWSRSRLRRATSSIWAAPIIGAVAGVIVVLGVLRDRQGPRRPGRRALGARPGRYLGHALVRHLHRAAARGATTGSAIRRVASGTRGSFHQLAPRRSGSRSRSSCVFVISLRDVLADQEDDRAAGLRGRGGRGPGHLRARDVRLPGAVHPAAGVSGRPAVHPAQPAGLRRRPRRWPPRRHTRPSKEGDDEEDRGIHPPRGVRADPDRAARARVSLLSISRSRARDARRASSSTTAAPP